MKPIKNRAAQWTRLAMVAAGLIGLAETGSRADYVLTDLSTLGGNESLAAGIDANGSVVGNSKTAMGGPSHAFLYRHGAMSDLNQSPLDRDSHAGAISTNGIQIVGDKVRSGFPGTPNATSFAGSLITLPSSAAFSQANGVNDSGQVVGQVFLSSGATPAFLSSGGLGTVLSELSVGAFSSAYGINNAGQIVGESAGHAVLWQGPTHTISDLGLGVAHAINTSGQIVGETSAGAVLWQGSIQTILGAGVAYAINNLGQAVGSANGSAVLYSGGQVIDLNTLISPALGWTLFEAMGINDAGQIAANGFGPNGETHAVLLSPIAAPAVPEPTSLALLAVGAAGCLVLGRRPLIRPAGRKGKLGR